MSDMSLLHKWHKNNPLFLRGDLTDIYRMQNRQKYFYKPFGVGELLKY